MSANKTSTVKFGTKSHIGNAYIETPFVFSELIIGNFTAIGGNQTYEFLDSGRNPCFGHHMEYVSVFAMSQFDWDIPKNIFPNVPPNPLKILIGSDVWIGRGCFFKSNNPDKPLVIGDGAVIAADSVVVKNVPPYAIVGGNPAKIIRYRFDPHIIDALLRIKWWDWDIDKIYDNFKYFNDIEKFISLHDRS